MASILKIKPRVGWVRADLVPAGEDMKDELLRLRREIDSLNGEPIIANNRAAPEGVDDLAQGPDTTNITINFESLGMFSLDVRWDSLMRAILPQTFGGGAPPEAIAAAMANLVQREADPECGTRRGDGACEDAVARSRKPRVATRRRFAKRLRQGDESNGGAGFGRGPHGPHQPAGHPVVRDALRHPNWNASVGGQARATCVISEPV
jgi:hypothetical protein